MIHIRGQVDENDIAYVSQRFGEPLFGMPCPIENGKIKPHTTRFYYGEQNGEHIFRDVIHIKPIYYSVRDTHEWRPLYEVASYYGNKRGMVLKPDAWEKICPSYLSWYMKRQQIVKGYNIAIGYPNTYLGKVVSTTKVPLMIGTQCSGTSGVACYPDPDVETTSVDGVVFYDPAETPTWSNIHDHTGASAAANDTNTAGSAGMVQCGNTANNYKQIQRMVLLFDTSAIPSGNTISAATLSLYGDSKTETLSGGAVNIYQGVPASNTALVAADYNKANFTHDGTGVYSTEQTIASMSTTAYNDFVLNASGISNIGKGTGNLSKFAARESNYDAPSDAGTAPDCSGGGGKFCRIVCILADTTGTSTDPKLVVTHAGAGQPSFLLFFTTTG